MLNIPNLLSYLEEQQGYDKISIEELFENFVKHHNSIKNHVIK